MICIFVPQTKGFTSACQSFLTATGCSFDHFTSRMGLPFSPKSLLVGSGTWRGEKLLLGIVVALNTCHNFRTSCKTAPNNVFGTVIYLFWRKDRNIIFINQSCFFFNDTFVGFLFQFLAGHPEKHVFLAEFCSQKFTKSISASWSKHQLVKRLSPGIYFFKSRSWAWGGRRGQEERS